MKKVVLLIIFILIFFRSYCQQIDPITLFSFFCQVHNWDINLLKDINLQRNRSLDNLFRSVTYSAAPIAYGVPVLLWLLASLKKIAWMQIKAGFIFISIGMTFLISTLIKHVVNRPRPYITYPFIEQKTSGVSPSFPSGHTCDAFAFAISISLCFPKWYIIIPSICWAMAVGYSRMDLGVHYPTDIIGSIVIAFLSSVFWYAVFKRNEKNYL